jgi:predicted kinase
VRDTAPLVVIVTGPPGSGKTTLGARLTAELAWPFVSRDAFKELLFDHLGWSDRAWSRKLGGASWELFYQVLDLLLVDRASCVVESNFQSEVDGARFEQLQRRHNFTAVQIVCNADDATLLRRFESRATDGTRHPSHVDHLNSAEFAAVLAARHDYALGLNGPLVTLDTTQPGDIDLDSLVQTIRALKPTEPLHRRVLR